MEEALLFRNIIQTYYGTSKRIFIVVAPTALHAACPYDYVLVQRDTRFECGKVYLTNSLDDMNDVFDGPVLLVVLNVRIPRFRALRLFKKHKVRIFPFLTDVSPSVLSCTDFFERPLCTTIRVHGFRDCDAFIDDWGWRFGEVCNASDCGWSELEHQFSWDGATSPDEIRAVVSSVYPNRCKMWFIFPTDRDGVLFFQNYDPFRNAYRGR